MHLAKLFGLVFICMSMGMAPALAGAKVKVTTQTYDISGPSGAALMAAMDQRGPKHGFLTRAIAQTRYSVAWDMESAETAGNCKFKRANATLFLNYTYPRVVSPMAGPLLQRWGRFMSGVRKHEEKHGDIARQMVRAAERSVNALKTSGDRGCRKLTTEAKRVVNAIYADYERRQVAFDNKEHRQKGNVEGLVSALVK